MSDATRLSAVASLNRACAADFGHFVSQRRSLCANLPALLLLYLFTCNKKGS